MSNLKKLLAVIVTVCLLATMTIPAFAAASDAEICEKLSILKGEGAGVTDEYLAKGTNRFQAALLYLRLIGLEDEALAFTGEDNFDDAGLIYKGGQRVLAYLKANPELGWLGIGGNKFDPTGAASAQMIYKVMLEALGYKQGEDFEWAEVKDFAAKIGLSKIADVTELTNNDVAIAIVEALKAKVKGSDKTLAQKLIEDDIIDEAVAAEYGLVELVPPTLEVVSVSADNLKEVVVVFNQPVDGDTVNKDNIKVDGKDGSVSLKDDKVTVVITIDGNGLENQSEYKLVVSGVKSADGTEIEKTEIKFKAFDATLPVAEKITVTGPNSFTITFSEPIKDKEEASVDVKSGTSVIGVDSKFGVGGRDVTVKLYSSLVDGKTYEITVKGFKDYAGYQNVIKTFELAYAKDNSAPTATIEKVDQKYVVVKFNKPVTGLHKNQFWHTFTAWTPIGIYSDEGMRTPVTTSASVSVDKVWVKFAKDADTGKPIAEGTTRFGILGKATDEGGTSYEIKDNWDNKFETTEFTISVSADKTAPTVEELTVETEQTLKIKFSEDVVLNDDNVKDKVKIYDTDGKSIDGVSVTVRGSGKEYTIDLGKELPGKTIVVELKDVEDKALQPNRMSTYTATLTITDKTDPVVTKVTKKESGDRKTAILYVFFNEDVDSTALDKANYALIKDGKLTILSKDPAFFDGNKVVKLELTESEYTELKKKGTGLFVQRVKDLAGNAMAGMTVTSILDYNNPANAPQVEKIEVLAADKAAIMFDQYLKRVDRNAIKVNGTTVAAIELSEKDGKTVVTVIITDKDAKFVPNITGSSVVIASSGDYKILNIFDVEATYENITNTTKKDDKYVMVDKIAPSVIKDGDNGSYVYSGTKQIVLKYDEAIKAAAVSILTYEVEGFKVDEVKVSDEGKTVTITVSKDDDFDDGFEENAKVKVTQKYPVVGKDGNESKFDSIELTVKDAPNPGEG